jgi:hypothetical protein
MILPLARTLNIPNQDLTTMVGSSARQILTLLESGFQQNAGHREWKPSQPQSLDW